MNDDSDVSPRRGIGGGGDGRREKAAGTLVTPGSDVTVQRASGNAREYGLP